MTKFLTSVLLFSLVSVPALADTEKATYGDNPSSQETTGFFTGVALGALAGGPPGAIVGGALGAVFGDGWHARQEVRSLQVDLVQSQQALNKLTEKSANLQREYQLALGELDSSRSQKPSLFNVALTPEEISSCCDNAGLSVHFRSGSSEIEAQYAEQLTSMAKMAGLLGTSRIEIEGYADRNGDGEMNLNLSKQRSNSVKAFFNRMGVQNSEITTVAYGETQPLQPSQSFESDFFDRRVIVRLRDPSKQMLTQGPSDK
jgi:sortase system peptidoglycan-associated protein